MNASVLRILSMKGNWKELCALLGNFAHLKMGAKLIFF